MDASRGEVELTVTSAQPLDSRTLGRLESAVAKSQYVGQGKKLKVVNEVCLIIFTNFPYNLSLSLIHENIWAEYISTQLKKLNTNHSPLLNRSTPTSSAVSSSTSAAEQSISASHPASQR